MYAKLPPLWKLRGLILCSSLTVLFSQGCAVDISHLQAPSDAAAGHEDTKLDGALADAATLNRDAVPQDTNRSPDYSAREDTSPDGARMPDLLPSATDGRADSREDSQTVPDRAPSSDTKTFVDVAAPEVPGTTDAADATVASPDLAIPADAPQKLDSVPDVPPTVVNISQGKAATASSEQTGKEAIFGNDGASGSGFCGANATFPVWWRVDLGATFNIVRTEVAFEKPENTYFYKIEISNDDSTYTTVVDQSANTTRAGTLETDTFSAQARYIRITLLGTSPADAASSCFSEFAVWGYASPGSPAATLTNLALSGTAYRWYGNTDATANSNSFAEPKLNDNSVSVDLSLAGDVYPDGRDNYEAAGVLLPQASTITSVVFVQGATLDPPPFVPGDPDGNFTSDFHLQLSTDGTTWADAEGWSLAPAYPYDATASNHAYVFSGSATGAVGVRVTGLIRPDDVKSAYARARELQVWGR